ncbi:MAG: DUF177 domain-containing protein [Oscillospiraceae bacterium]|nr:DUF177 domain-containing protein [Oscillospiraceae bacterium]
MMLDLRAVMEQPGAAAPFRHQLDLPGMSFPFGRPFAAPIEIDGHVKNTAGLVTLDAMMRTVLHLICDRCLLQFTKPMELPVSQTLAETLAGDADDEIMLVKGGWLDLDEALIPPLVLSMESQRLCREDCCGLCPWCGQNLNDGPCACGPGVEDN